VAVEPRNRDHVQEEEYLVENSFVEGNSDMLSTEEAQETFMKAQYASLLSSSTEMNTEEWMR